MGDYGVMFPIVNLARKHWAKPPNERYLLREGESAREDNVGCITALNLGLFPIFVNATKNVLDPITIGVALQGMEPPSLPGNNQVGFGLPDLINLQGPWRKNHLTEDLLAFLIDRFHSRPNPIRALPFSLLGGKELLGYSQDVEKAKRPSHGGLRCQMLCRLN